jgi:hypothetical protein
MYIYYLAHTIQNKLTTTRIKKSSLSFPAPAVTCWRGSRHLRRGNRLDSPPRRGNLLDPPSMSHAPPPARGRAPPLAARTERRARASVVQSSRQWRRRHPTVALCLRSRPGEKLGEMGRVEEEARGGGMRGREKKGSNLRAGGNQHALHREDLRAPSCVFLWSDESSDEGVRTAASRPDSARFRGAELGKFCAAFTRDEAVPRNLLTFPRFNSEYSPNGGK